MYTIDDHIEVVVKMLKQDRKESPEKIQTRDQCPQIIRFEINYLGTILHHSKEVNEKG